MEIWPGRPYPLGATHYNDVTFVLPSERQGELWVTEVDTDGKQEGVARAGGDSFAVAARSMQLLRST